MAGKVVYLIHFDEPFKHAKHYLGSADNLEQRLAQHRAGHGARLLAVIKDAGIGWTLARTWQGDRRLERQLKRRGGASRICPICYPDTYHRATLAPSAVLPGALADDGCARTMVS